jgi:predicted component of type VI protein secretion system
MEAALSGPSGRTALGPAPLRMGRAPDNALVLTDPQSSSRHAEIAPAYGGNGYQITDLNSTNGTFVNEQRLAPNAPRPLNAGDVIRIGNTNITYEVSGSYIPTVPSNTPNYEPTVAAAPPPDLFTPPPQPASPPPSAYGNFGTSPQQPPFTPQPAYAPPQPAYAQAQPAYPQAQPSYPQAGYPQPAYPQPQPGYPQPPKKSRAGLIVVIVVILLLVVGGGGGAFLYIQSRPTPQKTLAAYCDGWKTNNAQEIYDQADSAQQQKTSVSKLQQAMGLLNVLGGVKDCTVTNVQQNGSTATGTITLTFGDGKSEMLTDTLIQENGAWKIDSETSKLNP